MNDDLRVIVDSLCSSKKLDRDRAIPELEKYIHATNTEGIQELGETLIAYGANTDPAWELRNCSMIASICLLNEMRGRDQYWENFTEDMRRIALALLNDNEARVRLAAGEVLGKLCEKCGPNVYADSKEIVLGLIESNLERDLSNCNSQGRRSLTDVECNSDEETDEIYPTNSNRYTDAASLFHDTAGWKSLETSIKALQFMVEGCGLQFIPWITQELLDLIFKSLVHKNRFVRETGYYVMASIINTSCSETVPDINETGTSISENGLLLTYGHQFSHNLGIGLTDNWSQVRLAAAEATRKFLLSLDDEVRTLFYPELLPKLCLNRYYLAEGVRLYSLETWKLVVKTEGRNLVAQYIDVVVKHYISQTTVNNHAVREAACSCIAELAIKINPEVVKPYISELLSSLIVCFQDDSWPVRDSACLACGNFIKCFPEESRDSLEVLFPLFFANLEDTIPSVRQGAAAALANVVKAYGQDALDVVLNKVKLGLERVCEQPAESEKYSGLEKGPAPFGVVKRLRDNDMELHSNKTMYSCGSLAPKMRCGGGCMSGLMRTYHQPSQPWELGDGCIVLVSELISVPEFAPHVPIMLELISKATTYRHYTHHMNLLETTCKQLPVIAMAMGKRDFKTSLHMFIEPIFYSLKAENGLTSIAASQCIEQLSTFLGPNIFRSRIEQFDPNYLAQLDALLQVTA